MDLRLFVFTHQHLPPCLVQLYPAPLRGKGPVFKIKKSSAPREPPAEEGLSGTIKKFSYTKNVSVCIIAISQRCFEQHVMELKWSNAVSRRF